MLMKISFLCLKIVYVRVFSIARTTYSQTIVDIDSWLAVMTSRGRKR